MAEANSPIATEGIASALGIDRRSVDQLIADVHDAMGERSNEITRRVQAIYASQGSAEVKFQSVVSYTEASVLNDNSIKTQLAVSLGVALVGGLILTIGTLLAYIVGVILILIALKMAMEPAKEALEQFKAAISEF